jgi:hypothetical protein
MPDTRETTGTSIQGALAIAPSVAAALDAAEMPLEIRPVDTWVAWLCAVAIAIGIALPHPPVLG